MKRITQILLITSLIMLTSINSFATPSDKIKNKANKPDTPEFIDVYKFHGKTFITHEIDQESQWEIDANKLNSRMDFWCTGSIFKK